MSATRAEDADHSQEVLRDCVYALCKWRDEEAQRGELLGVHGGILMMCVMTEGCALRNVACE